MSAVRAYLCHWLQLMCVRECKHARMQWLSVEIAVRYSLPICQSPIALRRRFASAEITHYALRITA